MPRYKGAVLIHNNRRGVRASCLARLYARPSLFTVYGCKVSHFLLPAKTLFKRKPAKLRPCDDGKTRLCACKSTFRAVACPFCIGISLFCNGVCLFRIGVSPFCIVICPLRIIVCPACVVNAAFGLVVCTEIVVGLRGDRVRSACRPTTISAQTMS